MSAPYFLDADPSSPFPSVDEALDAHLGLLAITADLHPLRIVNAYRGGIFPWYNDDEPIAWYAPPIRLLLPTGQNPLGRRFRKKSTPLPWHVTADQSFLEVMQACASVVRPGQSGGTWINADMMAAYEVLHASGIAHSVEVRDADGGLVGGLYGLFVRGMFCGDSMFSRESGASKLAFAALCRFLDQQGIAWIDGQLPNDYLTSLGGVACPRREFMDILLHSGESELGHSSWSRSFGTVPISAVC